MPTDPTPKKKAAFLEALGETHLVTEAARRAGVHRSTVYDWRERDEKFAGEWGDVEERSTEILEQIAVKRAAAGSDVLLIFLLKSRRPHVYREHHRVEHTGPRGEPLNVEVTLDDSARETLASVLRGRPATRGQ